MRELEISVEVSGAPIMHFNGTYFRTNSSKVNNTIQYTKTASFMMYPNVPFIEKRDDDKWYFLQWKFSSDTNSDGIKQILEYMCESVIINLDGGNVMPAPPASNWYQVKTFRNTSIRMSSKFTFVNKSSNESFLFSDKFSDVHFHCPDGTIIHAHKLILSTQSSYFSTVFEGPWDKQHPNNDWVTAIPPDILRIVLKFIYTGVFIQLESTLEELFSILALAHEYELKLLVEAISDKLILMMDMKSIKDITQKAYIYNLNNLKVSCITFIHTNFVGVLMEESFMELATESDSIWSDLKSDLKEISPKLLLERNQLKVTRFGQI